MRTGSLVSMRRSRQASRGSIWLLLVAVVVCGACGDRSTANRLGTIEAGTYEFNAPGLKHTIMVESGGTYVAYWQDNLREPYQAKRGHVRPGRDGWFRFERSDSSRPGESAPVTMYATVAASGFVLRSAKEDPSGWTFQRVP